MNKTRNELIKEIAEYANRNVVVLDDFTIDRCLTDEQKKFKITMEDFCKYTPDSPYEAMVIGCMEYVPKYDISDLDYHNERETWIKGIWDRTISIIKEEKEKKVHNGLANELENNEFDGWLSLEHYLIQNFDYDSLS